MVLAHLLLGSAICCLLIVTFFIIKLEYNSLNEADVSKIVTVVRKGDDESVYQCEEDEDGTVQCKREQSRQSKRACPCDYKPSKYNSAYAVNPKNIEAPQTTEHVTYQIDGESAIKIYDNDLSINSESDVNNLVTAASEILQSDDERERCEILKESFKQIKRNRSKRKHMKDQQTSYCLINNPTITILKKKKPKCRDATTNPQRIGHTGIGMQTDPIDLRQSIKQTPDMVNANTSAIDIKSESKIILDERNNINPNVSCITLTVKEKGPPKNSAEPKKYSYAGIGSQTDPVIKRSLNHRTPAIVNTNRSAIDIEIVKSKSKIVLDEEKNITTNVSCITFTVKDKGIPKNYTVDLESPKHRGKRNRDRNKLIKEILTGLQKLRRVIHENEKADSSFSDCVTEKILKSMTKVQTQLRNVIEELIAKDFCTDAPRAPVRRSLRSARDGPKAPEHGKKADPGSRNKPPKKTARKRSTVKVTFNECACPARKPRDAKASDRSASGRSSRRRQ